MKKARSLPCLKSLILLVEQRGIEPLTSALRTRRSAKLSYCPHSKTRKLQVPPLINQNSKLAAVTRIQFRVFSFKCRVRVRPRHESIVFQRARKRFPLPPARCFPAAQCSRAESHLRSLPPFATAKTV